MWKALRNLAYLVLLVSSVATANETVVRQEMKKKYPEVQVESVAKTPLPGIYEVYAGGQVLYVDEKVNYLIVNGRLIDVARRADLTEERMRVLTAVKFNQLPLDLAFRIVKGDGKRQMAYFTDPNCPFCKRLDQELVKVNNVTVHVFLYPVLSQDSRDKAEAVWCSKDRAKAYLDLMLNDIPPKSAAACSTPIDKILAYGRQKGISGTPTMFFADGQRVSGAMPAARLEKLLDGAR
jgi:thiol:disulfide interchange protein DsbC